MSSYLLYLNLGHSGISSYIRKSMLSPKPSPSTKPGQDLPQPNGAGSLQNLARKRSSKIFLGIFRGPSARRSAELSNLGGV